MPPLVVARPLLDTLSGLEALGIDGLTLQQSISDQLTSQGIDPSTVTEQQFDTALGQAITASGANPNDPNVRGQVTRALVMLNTPAANWGTIKPLDAFVQQAKTALTSTDPNAATNSYLAGLGAALSAYVTSRTGTTTTTGQTRSYVDIPTPQEFLDDFQVGLATHLQQEVNAGRLQPQNQNYILEPRTGLQELLLKEYQAELGQQAAAGQNIWTVVGAGGPVTPLGTRPGEDTTKQVSTQGTETLSTGETRPVSDTSQDTTTTQENLATRPNLKVIHSLSFGNWMSKRFPTPGALATWTQDQKGVRLRTFETEAAAPIAAPVRQQALVS